MPWSSSTLKLFGLALSIKRGETKASYSKEAADIAKNTSESKLRGMIHEGTKKRRIK